MIKATPSAVVKEPIPVGSADQQYWQESRSALGHWTMHLDGAYSVLACEGDGRWLDSPRVVAQVGMLTWYVPTQGYN